MWTSANFLFRYRDGEVVLLTRNHGPARALLSGMVRGTRGTTAFPKFSKVIVNTIQLLLGIAAAAVALSAISRR